jgi:CheY-like chemotaxis protein
MVRFVPIRGASKGAKMDILVADDDRTGRFLVNSTLRELGHRVTEATNGSEAWEAWRRQRHQLIFSDWMMPCMDGLELCRRIRAEETSQLSYVILITAREGNANYLDAMNSGVDDFMTKPFERDRFIARVGVAMRILGLNQSLHWPSPTSSVGLRNARRNCKRRSRRKVNFSPAPATSCVPR